jgi:hypothetical protein
MIPRVCDGCLPHRDSNLNKHKSKAAHRCLGNGCPCGSCHPVAPVTNEQYRTWMEKLGGFYVENTKALVKIVTTGKVKKEETDT